MKLEGLLLAAVAFGLAACQTQIDMTKLSADIKADGAKMGITYSEVTCPASQTATAGGSFQCGVKDERGTPGTYTVKMKDAQGSVEYQLDQKYVDMKKVGDDLEGQLGQSVGAKVDVTCPDKNVIIKPGIVVVCDATSGSSSKKVVLTCKDNDGNFDIALQ
jgi:hypothetical protein